MADLQNLIQGIQNNDKQQHAKVLATIKNTIIPFVCPTKILHKHCFYFLLGLNNGPKRNWKHCLCKILEGQTKNIMVFLIVAN